jgi:AraC-like DNA-binding protein
MSNSFSKLNRLLKKFQFEPFAIDHLVDNAGHYNLELNKEFPLSIKLFSYSTLESALRLNWHNRLEIFIPVAGYGSFRMGNSIIDFSYGDILIVDNLKLHGLVNFQGQERRAVVISFNSELFYNLSSPLCDFSLLTPFYDLEQNVSPILNSTNKYLPEIHVALGKLLNCYFNLCNESCYHAGCKVYLSEVLLYLARNFSLSTTESSAYKQQMELSKRLGALIEYLQSNFAEKVTIAKAASMIGMSESRFMRFFKQATGMTFINYLTHIRLTYSYQLLKEPRLSIAEIAARTGFTDHSYFDKKFKQRFNKTPKQHREDLHS